MRLRHLRGSCVTLSLASTASRIVLLSLAGVAVDVSLSRSALGVPRFVRLSFEIWGAVGAVRVYTQALRHFGGPAHRARRWTAARSHEPNLARGAKMGSQGRVGVSTGAVLASGTSRL